MMQSSFPSGSRRTCHLSPRSMSSAAVAPRDTARATASSYFFTCRSRCILFFVVFGLGHLQEEERIPPAGGRRRPRRCVSSRLPAAGSTTPPETSRRWHRDIPSRRPALRRGLRSSCLPFRGTADGEHRDAEILDEKVVGTVALRLIAMRTIDAGCTVTTINCPFASVCTLPRCFVTPKRGSEERARRGRPETDAMLCRPEGR